MNTPRTTRTTLLAAALAAVVALPAAAGDPPTGTPAAGDPVRVESERSVNGAPVFVGEDGKAVLVEVTPGEPGSAVWVTQDVAVEEASDGGAPGDARQQIRAVFIGDGGEPIRVECDTANGDDCSGFKFDYNVVSPEALMAPRGYVGVIVTELTPELRVYFGAPEGAGVLVARVEPDSPAAAAGVRVGDVITEVDGAAITSSFGLRAQIRDVADGDTVLLGLVRDRKVETVTATVVERAVPEVDVRRFLLRREGGAGPGGPFVYQLDPGAVNDAVIELKERLGSPELEKHVVRLRGVEGDLEARIRDLERKLQAVQEQLDAGNGKAAQEPAEKPR